MPKSRDDNNSPKNQKKKYNLDAERKNNLKKKS